MPTDGSALLNVTPLDVLPTVISIVAQPAVLFESQMVAFVVPATSP
jgi:hypothetical protein